MHSAVLQNKKYVSSSKKNSVEVLALGSLEKGIANEDPKAETYTAKNELGETVEYMKSWPGLTAADIISLSKSKARTYNKSGYIPYTAIVNPHTLEEMSHYQGGQSSNTLIKGVAQARRLLKKSHGEGISRKDMAVIEESVASSEKLTKEMNFGKALTDLTKAVKGKKLPEMLTEKIERARERVIMEAEAELETFESLALINPARVKTELGKLKKNFRGTGLEEQVAEILKRVSTN